MGEASAALLSSLVCTLMNKLSWVGVAFLACLHHLRPHSFQKSPCTQPTGHLSDALGCLPPGLLTELVCRGCVQLRERGALL